jgi:hypothetical protein
MKFKIHKSIVTLLPKAIAWAEAQSDYVVRHGMALNETLREMAVNAGVRNPHLIRIAEVTQIPLPEDPDLQVAAAAIGMIGPKVVGLTLGYGIYILKGHKSNQLLSHEFRHVQQYEQAGSIRKYLPIYLGQITTFGYQNAPFEVDARAHEAFSFRGGYAPRYSQAPRLKGAGSR